MPPQLRSVLQSRAMARAFFDAALPPLLRELCPDVPIDIGLEAQGDWVRWPRVKQFGVFNYSREPLNLRLWLRVPTDDAVCASALERLRLDIESMLGDRNAHIDAFGVAFVESPQTLGNPSILVMAEATVHEDARLSLSPRSVAMRSLPEAPQLLLAAQFPGAEIIYGLGLCIKDIRRQRQQHHNIRLVPGADNAEANLRHVREVCAARFEDTATVTQVYWELRQGAQRAPFLALVVCRPDPPPQ